MSGVASISIAIVFLFGVVIGALCVWGLCAPARLIQLVKRMMRWDIGIHLAIVVRVALGLAVIAAAVESRFPLAFHALGWIAIIAAVGLAIMGKVRMRKFIAWFDQRSTAVLRAWLLVGIAFAGFLMYGAT
jgi:hypothetical protein